jgi:hypothetical protein
MKHIITIIILLFFATVAHSQKAARVKTVADVCDNSLFSYTIQGSTKASIALQYYWVRPAVPGIANPQKSGNTKQISEYLNNTTAAPITVKYIITMTQAGGCGHTDTLRVRVNPTPRLISSLTAQVCDYSILNYTPVSNVASASFTWVRPSVDGIHNTASTGVVKVNERLLNSARRIVKTPYYIESEAAGCVGRDTLWTTVIPRPFGLINLSADTVKSGQSLNLSFSTGDTIHYRYMWEFGDKLTANTALNPVDHIYNTRVSKEHAIKTTITNRFSCVDSFTTKVYVIGDPKVTPTDTLAVERNYTMAAFPVPFTSELKLKYSLVGPDEPAMYYVNDLAGRVIYAQKITLPGGNSIIKLPSDRLISGVVYVIRVKSRTFDYEDKVYRK